MVAWSIRAAQLLLFLFLLSERHGSCAALGEQGRAMGFREERPSGSLWNLGQKKAFGAAATSLVKGNKLSTEIPNELQDRIMISEVLTDGRQRSCRKCLTKTIQSNTLRKLLEARGLQDSTDQLPKSQAPIPLPPSHSQPETNKSSSVPLRAIYALCISGALGLVVIASTVYLLLSRRKKDNTVNPWATGLSGQLRKAFVTGVPSLGRAELEAACENFSNVIGTVSDSALYKGILSSGVEIAVASSPVKSAKEWSDRSEEQFRNKISVLSKVNHKNFMNLLGYCTCDDPFTRMMVFEYAPCGSLFEHLHSDQGSRAPGLAYPAAHHHGSNILPGAHEPARPSRHPKNPQLLVHLPHRGLRGQVLGHRVLEGRHSRRSADAIRRPGQHRLQVRDTAARGDLRPAALL